MPRNDSALFLLRRGGFFQRIHLGSILLNKFRTAIGDYTRSCSVLSSHRRGPVASGFCRAFPGIVQHSCKCTCACISWCFEYHSYPFPKRVLFTRVFPFIFVKVNFIPLDITDEEDVALVLQHADYITQYGEDLEPKQPKDDVSSLVRFIHSIRTVLLLRHCELFACLPQQEDLQYLRTAMLLHASSNVGETPAHCIVEPPLACLSAQLSRMAFISQHPTGRSYGVRDLDCGASALVSPPLGFRSAVL